MNLRRGVLWDLGAVLALLDADDADHEAVAIDGQIASDKRPNFIANYIEVEAHALLLRMLGRTLAREISLRHSEKDWSFCDAISFAVLDLREIRRPFTFDRHFLQYGRIEVLGLSR